MNKNSRKIDIRGFCIFIITLIVLFCVIEIALRVSYPLYSNYNTEMWRYSSELKRVSSYPGLSHEHVPNNTSSLYGVRITTNTLGLRADREYMIPKPRSVKRILVLGDSITMGWGVDFSDTFAQILETKLNKYYKENSSFEVINGGVGNYNSLCELATLKKLMKLEPDIIILAYYINDIEKTPYSSGIGHLIKKSVYLYSFLFDKYVKLKYRKGNNYKQYYSGLYQDEKLRKNARNAIKEMIGIANQNSIPFILMNIPEFHNFKSNEFKMVRKFLDGIVKEHREIFFIDLLENFKNRDAATFWVSMEDPHPNKKGNMIIADRLFNFLSGKEAWLK